jgi:hypothetical protein
MTDCAARGGTQLPVVTRDMPCSCTDGGSLEATFGVCSGWNDRYGKSRNEKSRSDHRQSFAKRTRFQPPSEARSFVKLPSCLAVEVRSAEGLSALGRGELRAKNRDVCASNSGRKTESAVA